MKGTLYILPCSIGVDEGSLMHLPANLKNYIDSINEYIVENTRSARRFIRKVSQEKDISEIVFHEINKHEPNNLEAFLKSAIEGHHIGLLSEAGIASIADPGFETVSLAHEKGIHVQPVSGPSSIILALSASGMNGQLFTFNGYLPIDQHSRVSKLKTLSKLASQNHTQIFMEAPYRNNPLLEDVLNHCLEEIKLCVACNLTQANEYIKTLKIRDWNTKKTKPDLHKKPAIFILGK